MMRCWCINADDRLDFSKIVQKLETYLEELVIYFDPSRPDPQEDPYSRWKLVKEIGEGEDEDADPGGQQSNGGNDTTTTTTTTAIQVNKIGSSHSLNNLMQGHKLNTWDVSDDSDLKSVATRRSPPVLKGSTL